MKMYRQGDVLVVKVDVLPDGMTVVPREDDKIVLAHGEATGHTHAIHNRVAKFFEETPTKRRYLELPQQSKVVHEEHAPIDLEPGYYQVIRQREYHPQEIKNVAD